jgi:beta-lactam-binding protein with PASTA domain
MVTVPDVRGLPTAEALQKLQDAGLTGPVRLTDQSGATVPIERGGIVAGQSPRPGSTVPANTAVTLTIRPDGLG